MSCDSICARGEDDVIRLNGFYLYEVGSQVHPIAEIKEGDGHEKAYFSLLVAEGALSPFLLRSIYRPKTSYGPANTLLDLIRASKAKFEEDMNRIIDHYEAWSIRTALLKFEAVVGAELGISPIYLVNQKGAYDTDMLVSEGQMLFPAELNNKVPEAIPDIKQATKCLAFELPTACGFHLHRANETVLHKYYDAVTQGAQRPQSRNMGDYLNELNKLSVGDKITKSALKDLKDMHRNPLIHPEHTLENIDQAVALLGSIQAIITRMLDEIPINPPPAPQIAPIGSVSVLPHPNTLRN